MLRFRMASKVRRGRLAFSTLLVCLAAWCALAAEPQAASVVDPSVERAVMKVLDDYMTAWNAKDIAAWEKTFHFPHYRLASGQMRVLDHAGMQDAAKVWAQIDGWQRSAWDHRRIVHWSSDKVHVDTRFTRYRADGSKIGTYDSLYVVTKESGRWGVKLRSSFAQ